MNGLYEELAMPFEGCSIRSLFSCRWDILVVAMLCADASVVLYSRTFELSIVRNVSVCYIMASTLLLGDDACCIIFSILLASSARLLYTSITSEFMLTWYGLPAGTSMPFDSLTRFLARILFSSSSGG